MAASSHQVILKEKIKSLDTTEFLDTHVWIDNPHWQNSRIIIFLYKYDIVILDKLVGSFLDVLFFLLTVILSELHEKPRLSCGKKNIEEIMWGALLFWLHSFLSMSFSVAFFVFSIPLPTWCVCWMAAKKIRNIAMLGILCDDTMSERLKIWQALAI